jgi:MFS family permease
MGVRKFSPFAFPLLLLALSVLINYIDRGNLSIAAPLLKNELGISASQLGILLSAFFWTYTALLFVWGCFIDRFDVNLLLAFGYLAWSVATAATGIVQGFAMLLAMRLLLGLGESVMLPRRSRPVGPRTSGFAEAGLLAVSASQPWRSDGQWQLLASWVARLPDPILIWRG